MEPIAQPTRRARALTVAAIGVALFAGMTVATAGAAEKNEIQRGAALLGSAGQGARSCASLTKSDFAAVGEYVMQRMLGSPRAHESMDRAMRTMMGSSGLESMHRFLGERATGCARGPAPRGIGAMMGMVGMMSGGRGYGPGMIGGGMMGGRGFGPGRYPPGSYGPGMMGGRQLGGGADNHDGWSTAAIVVAIVLGAAVLLLGAAAVLASRLRGSASAMSDAVTILDQRFARGEIDGDEYQRRRAALGGGT